MVSDSDAKLLSSILEKIGIKLKMLNQVEDYAIEQIDEKAIHPYIKPTFKDSTAAAHSGMRNYDLSGNIKIGAFTEESRKDIPENIGSGSCWLGKGHAEADCLESKSTNLESEVIEHDINIDSNLKYFKDVRTSTILSFLRGKVPRKSRKVLHRRRITLIGNTEDGVSYNR